MMMKETARKIEALRKEFAGKSFNKWELMDSENYVSLSTLFKYDMIRKVDSKKEEITLEELVEIANRGIECEYDMNEWDGFNIELINGKPYKVFWKREYMFK